ncbi:MAG: AMP-binding protein, partial [Planctomycetota bacterium]
MSAAAEESSAERGSIEERLLREVEALVRELGGRPVNVRVAADLERELGLGSLERAELITRVERSFHVTLPDATLVEARTVRDLLRRVEGGANGPGPARKPAARGAAGKARSVLGDGAPRTEWAPPGPDRAETLVDVLRHYAEVEPDMHHIRFWQEEGPATPHTHRQLYERAMRVATGIARLSVQPKDRVALVFPSGPDFFAAFLGAQCAGCTPVPIYPPIRMDQIGPYLDRHARILGNAGATVLLTDELLAPVAGLLRDRVATLREVRTVTELENEPMLGAARVAPDDLGMIQYTSGSTGDPKGVALSHRNLLTNMRASGAGMELGPDDVICSWLPLYHDMGLIGSWMTAMLFRTPIVLMSPLQFLSRPERWLWAFHNYKGTIAPAPNFAYEMCVRKIQDDQIVGLDLSSWTKAMNGSEPVRKETVDRFCERFGPYGFQRSSMMPVYGMAECSVALAFPPVGREPRFDRIAREPFNRDGVARPATGTASTADESENATLS